MRVFVYGDKALPIIDACLAELACRGVDMVANAEQADLAVAPLLTVKLSKEDLVAPSIGTLIFHPSLLPRHRGRDAIKWAYRLKETYTGATWFWADSGLDTGDICEMEVLAIDPVKPPREFYNRLVIPACVRMLGYIISDIQNGVIRRRPQQHEHATYESPIAK